MTIHLTRWTAAGAAALAVAGLGGGIAAAATSTPASPTVTSSLTAKLIAVTPAKGQASPGKHATGSFSGTLKKNDKVSYRITFSGLSAPVTGAMLQFGTPGKASTKSMPIAITKGLSPVKGAITLTAKQAASVRAGKAWISLETKKDVTGAIRGRIMA